MLEDLEHGRRMNCWDGKEDIGMKEKEEILTSGLRFLRLIFEVLIFPVSSSSETFLSS